jgi:hypothetical protein
MIETIISDLYAGILGPMAWDRALFATANLVRGSAAFLFAFNPTIKEVLRDENHHGDPRVLEDYRRHWVYKDCRFDPAHTDP